MSNQLQNLNAKVKRLIKKTKKEEEKPEFRFFPRNAHKRIKLPPPTFDTKKEAEKVKQIMERRTPEDLNQFVTMMSSAKMLFTDMLKNMG